MKGFWKKIHRKTAVALMTSMLVTSVVPITGMAEIYGLNSIFSDDEVYDVSDYLATASVAAKASGEQEIDIASGSNTGSAAFDVGYEIEVSEVATASNATASNADWGQVKDEITEAIRANLEMDAAIYEIDADIKGFVTLDTTALNSESEVVAEINISKDAPLESLIGNSYKFTVRLTPELNDSLGDNITVRLEPCDFTITVNVGAGSNPDEPEEGSIRLKGFHGEEEGEATWIYVEDGPVDLNDYCETNPEDLKVDFTSKDPSIATVSSEGILKPVANGTTTVTAQIAEEGYAEKTAKLEVQVWTYEDMTDLPAYFTLYEGEAWEYTFSRALSRGATCVVDMDGNVVDETKVELDFSNERKTVAIAAKATGEYRLKCTQHVEAENLTYVGTVDFTVKPRRNTVFNMNGFHGETDNSEGITSTWTYVEDGTIYYLPYYCQTEPANPTFTFESSDETVARIEGNYLVPVSGGTVTITATMDAPGYHTEKDSLIVEVWKYDNANNLPDMITMHAGETWTRTLAEPLRSRTKILMYNTQTGEEVDSSVVKTHISEDFRTIEVTAKQPGHYQLYYRCHNEENLTTYYNERMFIEVLEAGVTLDVPTSQLTVEPGESKTFDVAFSPKDAQLDLEFDREIIDAVYKDGKITVTGKKETEDYRTELGVVLVDANDESKVLAEKWIPVYVVKKQLETTTPEEALAEAGTKIDAALENGNAAEIVKIVDEVVEVLAAASETELAANQDAIDKLEAKLSAVATVEDEVYDETTEIETCGALLNLISMGEATGKMVVEPVEDAGNTNGVTLDIKLQRGSNGENITELAVPMQLRIKVSGIDLNKRIRIKHTKENGTVKWIYPEVDGKYIVFWVDSYSEFAISNYTQSSGGSGGGGGGSSSSVSSSGSVSSDAKKGYVNSVTGIITGSAAGYSQWNQDETGWKLKYADGTFAAGTMVTDELGNVHEQVAWEMINGAWYPFGANGYVKGGLVYDVALGGTFYVDINSGMKTGWQLVDGVWRYFNTVSDGKRGIMLTDTTIDGCYINAEGIWNAAE